MVAPGRWFTNQSILALKFLSGYVHRGTLPQSRIRSTAPSEREPGMGLCHSTCRLETGRVRAIFIAPTKLKSFLHFTTHRGTLPQSRVRSTAPSEREPGMGLCHSACRPETGGVRAIFIAPTKAQNVLHFTIHRGGCKIRKGPSWGRWPLGGYFSRITGQVVLTALLM